MEKDTARAIKKNTLLEKYLGQSKLLFGSELYYNRIKNKNRFDLILVSEYSNFSSIEEKPIDWKYEKLLNNIIQSIGKKLDYDVLLVTVFKERPDFVRNPLKEEILDFKERLSTVTNLYRPRLILALGKVVGECLIKKNMSINNMRNLTSSFDGIPLRVTYDINSILHNPEYKKPTWIDFQWVRDFLIN